MWYILSTHFTRMIPDSKVHVAKMGPTWVLSTPGGPHVGPVILAIRDACCPLLKIMWHFYVTVTQMTLILPSIQHPRNAPMRLSCLGRQSYDIFWYPWWRHQMETFSALLALCAGNLRVTGEWLRDLMLKPAGPWMDPYFHLSIHCILIELYCGGRGDRTAAKY